MNKKTVLVIVVTALVVVLLMAAIAAFLIFTNTDIFDNLFNRAADNQPGSESVVSSTQNTPVNTTPAITTPETTSATEPVITETDEPEVTTEETPVADVPVVNDPEGKVIITGIGVNIRAGAGTGFSKVTSCTLGNILDTYGSEYDSDGTLWYKVKARNGKTGYVTSLYALTYDESKTDEYNVILNKKLDDEIHSKLEGTWVSVQADEDLMKVSQLTFYEDGTYTNGFGGFENALSDLIKEYYSDVAYDWNPETDKYGWFRSDDLYVQQDGGLYTLDVWYTDLTHFNIDYTVTYNPVEDYEPEDYYYYSESCELIGNKKLKIKTEYGTDTYIKFSNDKVDYVYDYSEKLYELYMNNEWD